MAQSKRSSRSARVLSSSAEGMAYKLMQRIAAIENRNLSAKPRPGKTPVDRNWILNTYSECIEAVKGDRLRAANDDPSRRPKAI